MKPARPFAALLGQALCFGILAGAVSHLGLILTVGITRDFQDALVFSAFLAVGGIVGYLVLNLFGGILALVICRGPEKRGRFLFGLDVFALLVVVAASCFIAASRPFWIGNPGHATGLVAMTIAAFAVSFVLAKLPLWRLFPHWKFLLPVSLLFWLTPAGYVYWENAQQPEFHEEKVPMQLREGHKVFLVGFDGCTWDVLDPLLAEGRLPNFQRLIEQGSSGVLWSEMAVIQPFADSASKGMRTPVIWETIATGRTPRDHGIWDFYRTRMRGLKATLPMRLPVPGPLGRLLQVHYKAVHSTDGRQLRLWEILEKFNLPSLVVGWVDTWPAFAMKEDVAGVQVSDRAHYDVQHLSWPAEDAQEYAWLYTVFPLVAKELGLSFDPDQPDPEVLQQILEAKDEFLLASRYKDLAKEILDFELDPEYAKKYQPEEALYWEHDLVGKGSGDLARDLFYADVAESYLQKLTAEGVKPWPRLSCFYFPSTDTSQHWFWRYYEPDAFENVDPGSVARLGPVIPKVYENADRILGRLMALADDQTTIVLVSDHGGGAWVELEAGPSLFQGQMMHQEYSGNHRQNGVILMKGPGIRAGEKLEADIYDVTPTVLYAIGLPAAENMPGRILEEAFEEEHKSRFPLRRIRDYGPREIPLSVLNVAMKGSLGDQEYDQRQQELGYAESEDEDEEP